MRGKDKKRSDPPAETGITPAYAGKRSSRCRCCVAIWDHPRLCGEKRGVLIYRKGMVGSPPPMRGKGQSRYLHMPCTGITPAYAGKSEITDKGSSIRRDHPRLCGEKEERYCQGCDVIGSPPPMRGKGSQIKAVACPIRITPAYAGKSCHSSPDSAGQRDHPRLCGEKMLLYFLA